MTEFREAIDAAVAEIALRWLPEGRPTEAALLSALEALDAAGYLADPPHHDAAAFAAAADVARACARHLPELTVGDRILCAGPGDTRAGALRRCLAAAVMTAGAVSTALDLTVRYVNTREQFGRPIGAFQAVKHQLARLAAERSACDAAAEGAVDAVAVDLDLTCVYTEMAILAARVRTAQAATAVARSAHQLHGAVGLTLEYPLGRFTNAMLRWRDCGIAEGRAGVELGRLVARDGNPFWSLIIRCTATSEKESRR